MNRDYINWLETLPCNRKTQKVNAWMGGWVAGRHCLERLICRLTRRFSRSGISVIAPTA